MSSQALTPYLTVSNAAAAVEFYKNALGAEELRRHAAPGEERLMHVHLRVYGSDLMLSDDFSDKMGTPPITPEALHGSPVTLHLQVDDVDTLWERAVAAGANVIMPLKDQFWGDRYGQFTDPFGHRWSVGQSIGNPTEEEIVEGAKAAFD